MRTAMLALFAFALVMAPTSEAAVKACSAARVSAGDCPSTSFTLLAFAVPTAELVEVADEIAESYGYPRIICGTADVAAGRCSAGQVGTVVSTPETKNAFANRKVSEWLRHWITLRRQRLAAAAAVEAVPAPQPID